MTDSDASDSESDSGATESVSDGVLFNFILAFWYTPVTLFRPLLTIMVLRRFEPSSVDMFLICDRVGTFIYTYLCTYLPVLR